MLHAFPALRARFAEEFLGNGGELHDELIISLSGSIALLRRTSPYTHAALDAEDPLRSSESNSATDIE
jgi:hypothetical protein